MYRITPGTRHENFGHGLGSKKSSRTLQSKRNDTESTHSARKHLQAISVAVDTGSAEVRTQNGLMQLPLTHIKLKDYSLLNTCSVQLVEEIKIKT